jgi:hypothetical protein
MIAKSINKAINKWNEKMLYDEKCRINALIREYQNPEYNKVSNNLYILELKLNMLSRQLGYNLVGTGNAFNPVRIEYRKGKKNKS